MLQWSVGCSVISIFFCLPAGEWFQIVSNHGFYCLPFLIVGMIFVSVEKTGETLSTDHPFLCCWLVLSVQHRFPY